MKTDELIESLLKEVTEEEVCSTCNGSGIMVENAGMCGGCEVCGNREEQEVPCPDCIGDDEPE